MNIIDTRDLYKQQCALQEVLDALRQDVEYAEEEYRDADVLDKAEYARAVVLVKQDLKVWQEEYQEELDELNQLENEIGDGWQSGVALIPEEDFEDYARDLAEDLYGNDIRAATWPFDCINWESAANKLRMDYYSCNYQGTSYLFR
jgi:hypothetical protein